jgi:hypothetical protein
MDYVCGPVILYSQDKVRMMDFLSDVFEFDVDVKNDTVSSGNLFLKLVECNQQEEFKSTGIIFVLKAKTQEQLKEILNKYNFFLYRKTAIEESAEAAELEIKEHGESLSVKDIDGRTWRFDFEKTI